MRKSLLLLYIAIALVSCAIITFALLTQYVWGEPFYDSVGALTIRGSGLNAINTNLRTITRAEVEYQGFIFTFDNPLVRMRDGRTIARYAIHSYRKEERALVLSFAEDIEIYFQFPQASKSELLVSIQDSRARSATADDDYLLLGYECPQEECPHTERIISVHRKEDPHYLYLPPQAELNDEHIFISLQSPIRTLQFSETYIPELLDMLHTNATRLLEEAAIPFPELQAQFIAHAYQNWQADSYLVGDGQWRGREGDAFFKESIMIASLAHAISEEEYTRTFNAMRRAYQQNKEATSILSLPYMGDSFTRIPLFSEQEKSLAARLQQLGNSSAILSDMHLLQYLYYRTSTETRQRFTTYITRSDYFTLNLYQLLNLVTYLLFEPEVHRDLIVEIVMNHIVPRIFVSRNGIFVTGIEEHIDFFATVRTAALLRYFSHVFEDDTFITLSDALQYSAINLADPHSYIPQYAILQDDRIASVRGYIDPADIYSYIAESSPADHLPYSAFRAILADDDMWLLSAVDVDVVSASENSIELQVVPPFAHNFYLVLGNSPRPRSVRIGGSEYALDPDFETRIRGWYWFSDYRIMIINFHRSDTSNTIVIRY